MVVKRGILFLNPGFQFCFTLSLIVEGPVWPNSPNSETQNMSLGMKCCFLYSPTLTSIHDHWKNHSLGKVMSLLFNTLSRFVITFLPRSKRFLILWLQSPSAVVLKPRKIKSATVSTASHLFPMK